MDMYNLHRLIYKTSTTKNLLQCIFFQAKLTSKNEKETEVCNRLINNCTK